MKRALVSAWLVLYAGCTSGGGLPGSDGGGICRAVCAENAECDFGQACRQNCCVTGCDSDNDCVSGEACRFDRCVPRTDAGPGGTPSDGGGAIGDGGTSCPGSSACAQNGDCNFGQACRRGCCATGCDTDNDCIATERCQNNRCVARPGTDAGVVSDGGLVADAGTGGGRVGDACSGDGDCADGTCLAGLPGGYCTHSGCETSGCPAGSTCFGLSGGGSACFKNCTLPSECRESEGYTCDADRTCYPGGTTGGDGGTGGTGLVGAACQSNADCGGNDCYPETSGQTPTGFVGGYCIQFDCSSGGCPSGSECFTVSQDGTTACLKTCSSESECRLGYDCTPTGSGSPSVCLPGCAGPSDCPASYACDTAQQMCVPPTAQCSPQNPTGPCPAGQVCNNGTCETFTCSDTRFEPNESQSAAASAPTGTTTGLALCASDTDWYKLSVPPHTIGTLGVIFQNSSGDLDLSCYTSGGQCLGGRLTQGFCSWSQRNFETGEEFLSTLNGAASGNKIFGWKLVGRSGATNRYSLVASLVPYTDGRDCGAPYTSTDCRGGGSFSNLQLIQFPFPDPSDGYVGDGYRFDSVANYRWARRELIMLVRYAIRETQAKFANTKPLGLIDICQRDGITPGYDVGDPRHPETTHDQGGNIDIAYYTTLASNGTLEYNEARIICDANEGSVESNGGFCRASAATTHVVDLPRQVYFMAKLYESARVRVIGVDKVIGPLLRQEAERQKNLGWITTTQRSAFDTKMAYGDGWPYHHHHIHLSLQWWGSAKPATEPPVGCGFDLRRYRAPRTLPGIRLK